MTNIEAFSRLREQTARRQAERLKIAMNIIDSQVVGVMTGWTIRSAWMVAGEMLQARKDFPLIWS
mgnify:CR=1 FL=1